MEMNPQAGSILGQAAPERAGIGAIATGDMVPDQMAGGGIVAFAKGEKVIESKAPSVDQQRMADLEKNIALRSDELWNTPQFSKSEAAQKAIADEIKASKDNAMWNLLKDVGVGTAKGTSQFALSNLGGGAEYAATQQEKRAAQEDANRKLMLQQDVEREKAEFARKTGMLNAMQTSYGQMINKDIGLKNVAASSAATAAAREQANMVRAQATYDNAVKAEKANLMAQNKNKFEFTYDSPELNATALANVNARLSPTMKNLLGMTGTPAAPAAPAAPAKPAAPAASNVKALPMPAKAADAVVGQVYNTSQGPAKWDGKQFIKI
jgi:hypothetical protein